MTREPHLPSAIDGYDFYDFGCSTGGNIAFVNRHLPDARGLGIDIDTAKVAAAVANGHHAIVFDILALPDRKLVDFVAMSHFLEHLSNLGDARKMIAKAITVSRDFILIRQPWFDADGALMRHGLKFYWSHWHGHRNKMTTLDFYTILSAEQARQRIRGFSIHGRAPVTSSMHPALLPLDAPIDQHQYQKDLHGSKPSMKLPFVAYKEVVVRVDIHDSDSADTLLAALGQLDPIFLSPPPATDGMRAPLS